MTSRVDVCVRCTRKSIDGLYDDVMCGRCWDEYWTEGGSEDMEPEEWAWRKRLLTDNPPAPVPVPVSTSIYHVHRWEWVSGGTRGLTPLYATCSCDLTYERYLRLLAGERGLLV